MKVWSPARDPGIRLLRIGVAVLLAIHGLSRIRSGGVVGFGAYLGGEGVPAGPLVAWILTLVEILGTPLLAAGIGVIPLAAWFAVELGAGIAMVHGREGWFVVGGGRNGSEYSVCLIIALAAIVASEIYWSGRGPARD